MTNQGPGCALNQGDSAPLGCLATVGDVLEKESAIGIPWMEARDAAECPTEQGTRTTPTAEDCPPQASSAVQRVRTPRGDSTAGVGRESAQALHGEGSRPSGGLACALAPPHLRSQFREVQNGPLPPGQPRAQAPWPRRTVPEPQRAGGAHAASAGSCLLFYPWPPTQLAPGPGTQRGANLIALMVCNQT